MTQTAPTPTAASPSTKPPFRRLVVFVGKP